MNITYEKLELLVMFASVYGVEMTATNGQYSEYLKSCMSDEVMYFGLIAVNKFLESTDEQHPAEFFRNLIKEDYRKNH